MSNDAMTKAQRKTDCSWSVMRLGVLRIVGRVRVFRRPKEFRRDKSAGGNLWQRR